MERSIFFNSAPGDPRSYQASDFADYFGKVLSTGLLHTDNVPALQVQCEGTDLRTYVEPGRAIMEGYGYENTSDIYLTHALPEATLDRIDRIVLRLDKRNQSRFIKLFVVQGVADANPVPPTLTRDEFIYELSLAQIRVRANTSTLVSSDLVDERLDEDLCGLVYSLISIPTSQFQAEWDSWFDTTTASFEQQYYDWFNDLQATGYASQSEFADLQTAFNEHSEEDATDAHNASNISVADPNAHFTGADVETVLDELFTFADDGKTSIATVVGSPATASDTFAQLEGHIQTSKDTLATNLTNKGQSSVGTEPLKDLADKVANVSTGKKFASGSVWCGSSLTFEYAGNSSTLNANAGTVNGLSFKPSYILMKYFNGNNVYMTVYEEMGQDFHPKVVKTFLVDGDALNPQVRNFKGDVSPASVTSTGFTLPVPTTGEYQWMAFE